MTEVRFTADAHADKISQMPSRFEKVASPPERAEEHELHPDTTQAGRLPIAFFLSAVVFFALGVSMLPFSSASIVEFFYQPMPLATVHVFTLGWITSTIMGVMYRYVPAVTRRPLRWPRMAWLQLALFVLGATGMVAHFAIGVWFGLWLAAIVVSASIVLFALNLFVCLAPEFGKGVAETGMLLAICFLLAASFLGTLLGIDKSFNFLGGSALSNLSAHLHLAAVGWVTLAICAVSYRMLPAFLLPKIQLPPAAKWQIYGLSISVVGLVVSLLLRSSATPLFAIATGGTSVWYVTIIARLVRSRRMPLDYTPMHAIAGVISLALAIVLGIALTFTGADSVAGARIAPAYGALGLFGFFSNFIIGMSYQLFAGFVIRARTASGYPAATIAEISIRRPRLFIFIAFNLGLVILVVGFLVGSADLARTGTSIAAAGGLVYCATTIATLSYAFRPSPPASAHRASVRALP